jgi:hypothetical protein
MTDMIQPYAINPPGLEFVFEASGDLSPPVLIGETPAGIQRVITITPGGPFSGPDICGRMIGGHDWQLTRPDGVTVVDAQYLLETDDGVRFQCRNRGLRHGPDDVMRRMGTEIVDPDSYYFRTAPVFSAPAGRYDWLNRSLFLCKGARFPDAVRVGFYRVT